MMSRPSFATRLLLSLWILGCCGLSSRAEVGVIRHGQEFRPFYDTIVDEPDPLGRGPWRRRSPQHLDRRILLNTDGDARGDGPPSVLYHPTSGKSIVVWARVEDDGQRKIVVSEFAAGQWSAPRRLNAANGEQLDPAVAVDPGGTLHVVFWTTLNSTEAVFYQILDAADTTWTLPVRISLPEEQAARPFIAIRAGLPHVVYELHAAEGLPAAGQVILAVPEPAGGWAREVVADSQQGGPLWPQVHARADKLWVDWVDFSQAPFDGEMAWLRRLDTGAWDDPVGYETFQSEEEFGFHVRGSIDRKVTGGTTSQVGEPPSQILP